MTFPREGLDWNQLEGIRQKVPDRNPDKEFLFLEQVQSSYSQGMGTKVSEKHRLVLGVRSRRESTVDGCNLTEVVLRTGRVNRS